MYPSSPLPQPYSRDHRASPVAARISRSFFVPIVVFCPNKIALHRWYALEKHKHKHRPLLFILSRFVPQVALLASPNPSLLLFIACFQTTTYIHCAQRVPPRRRLGLWSCRCRATHAFPQCGHICRGLLGARTTGSSSAPSASPCQTLRLSNGPPQLPGCFRRLSTPWA